MTFGPDGMFIAASPTFMCLKHRQLNVGDKEIECDRAFQKSQRVVSVPRVDYRVSGTAENSHDETTEGIVVVEHEDRGLCVHGCKLQTGYRPRIARNGCEKVNTAYLGQPILMKRKTIGCLRVSSTECQIPGR
jgi:hypothetical protein